MKILHVCETIKGGVATYLNTFDQLCGDVYENVYLVPQHHRDQLTVAGRVETFPATRRSASALMALCREAVRIARSEQPDVLYFHSSFALIAMAWLRLRRIPGRYAYCPHCWGQVPYTEKPILRHLIAGLEGRMVGLSDLVINISHNDKAIAQANAYRGRHIVIENALADLPDKEIGFPNSPYDSDEEGRVNLLFVGRLDRQKGLDVLLEAFSSALMRNPQLHLHIVGAGVANSNSPNLAAAPSRTSFHAWVPPHQIAAFYRHADLTVMPSRWEGLPMVLIESLRAGTPVMVSNRSGMGNLVEHGRTGFVIPLSAEEFGAALSDLDVEKLSAMRPACRELYEQRYAAERFRKETLAAISGLVEPVA